MNASKLIALLTRVLLIIATLAMVVMATIIAMNILGRSLFSRPILGTIDIAGLAGVVFASIAVGYTEWERRNVLVEVVVAKIPAAGEGIHRRVRSSVELSDNRRPHVGDVQGGRLRGELLADDFGNEAPAGAIQVCVVDRRDTSRCHSAAKRH